MAKVKPGTMSDEDLARRKKKAEDAAGVRGHLIGNWEKQETDIIVHRGVCLKEGCTGVMFIQPSPVGILIGGITESMQCPYVRSPA